MPARAFAAGDQVVTRQTADFHTWIRVRRPSGGYAMRPGLPALIAAQSTGTVRGYTAFTRPRRLAVQLDGWPDFQILAAEDDLDLLV